MNHTLVQQAAFHQYSMRRSPIEPSFETLSRVSHANLRCEGFQRVTLHVFFVLRVPSYKDPGRSRTPHVPRSECIDAHLAPHRVVVVPAHGDVRRHVDEEIRPRSAAWESKGGQSKCSVWTL